MKEGAFDNLPGKGQPLNLEDDPNTPPHLRLANRILKNANVLPDWVQLDVEIRKSKDEVAALFRRAEAEYHRRMSAGNDKAFAAWYLRTRSAYIRAIKQVNSDILKLNLASPQTVAGPAPFRIAEETARFDAAFPPPAGLDLAAVEPEAEREHKLRSLAEVRYRAANRG